MSIIPKYVNSIEYFQNDDYRVFLSASYFNIDIKKEIKWHTKHLKKLRQQKSSPIKFHQERGHKIVDKDKIRHHKEWVIDSIPFHEKFLLENKNRLELINSIMPIRTYNKLNSISLKYKGTPEYFIYHKKSKTYFFLALDNNHQKMKWIHLVKDKYKLCDVIILNNN